MTLRIACAIVVGLLTALPAAALDYRVEALSEAPPADQLAKDVADVLAPTGVRVFRGQTRIVCDIWLCKELAVKPDFEATAEVLYPFSPGQLVGVVRYPNKGGDFRDQDVPAGVYTLRYDLQPMDGNHEGTSPTRDFLLMVRPEDDKSIQAVNPDDLSAYSSDAVQTAHPGLLCMQEVTGEAETSPSIRHDQENDWWIVRLKANTKAGDAKKELLIDLVVVGYSEA